MARRSNQSILKEISPEYSLEGLMLKLKLQYFGHLIQRTDLLEKIFPILKAKDYFLSKTCNMLPKGNETLKYFFHFSSEMFALILPKQVCTWVNNPEEQITLPTMKVYPVAHTDVR